MKKSFRSAAGVTLLEIMLVLAVAAMVIVMSIRYYKNASESQNVNSLMQTLQGIMAAADSYAATSGQGYTGLTTSTITGFAGTSAMSNPFGAALTMGTATATTYIVNLSNIPSTACQVLIARMATNSKIVVNSGCTTMTYTSTN